MKCKTKPVISILLFFSSCLVGIMNKTVFFFILITMSIVHMYIPYLYVHTLFTCTYLVRSYVHTLFICTYLVHMYSKLGSPLCNSECKHCVGSDSTKCNGSVLRTTAVRLKYQIVRSTKNKKNLTLCKTYDYLI